MSWWPILVLAAGAYACKAVGVWLGQRLPRTTAATSPGPDGGAGDGRLVALVALLPAALLAGLIVVQTIGDGAGISLDARVAGVVVGGVAAWRRAPFLAVIILAGAVTAGLRALS